MRSVTFASPFRCRMWEFHNRLESLLTEKSCEAEIQSLLSHGQFVPALGRPLQYDPDYDVELICGARRLFAARHINKPLAVELRDLSDMEAIIAMETENRLRTDLSAYERGSGYARLLQSGLFPSQDELARTLDLSASQVSRLLRVASLPEVIVNAFESTHDISERWGRDLASMLQDESAREPALRCAREIAAEPQRPGAREIYCRLLASTMRPRRSATSDRDEIVRDEAGQPLFRIRRSNKMIVLLLPTQSISTETLAEVRDTVVHLLDSQSAGRSQQALSAS